MKTIHSGLDSALASSSTSSLESNFTVSTFFVTLGVGRNGTR